MRKSMKKIGILIGFLICGNTLSGQDLQSLIDIAIANSPTISKYEIQHEIALEKAEEVKDIPNTEFGVGYFASEPETRTGAQRFKVSAKQMIPWFGTNATKVDYTNALAETVLEDVSIVKRKLITSVTQTYYDLYALRANQTLIDEHYELLKALEELSLKGVETGTVSTVSILKLQMRLNNLDRNRQILKEEFLAVQTKFNKLLNRDATTEVFPIENLELPLADFDVQQENLKVHPELMKFDKLYESVDQLELLNNKQRSPMLGFGLDYVNVEERPDMDFSDNGKDIVMPMVSVSIPIFTKKYDSKSKQNKWQQEKLELEKQDRLNVLETTLQSAVSKRNSARINYNTQVKNIEQSNQLKDLLLKKYEVGTAKLTDVLEVDALELDLEKEQIKAVQQYYIQSSIISYLVAN